MNPRRPLFWTEFYIVVAIVALLGLIALPALIPKRPIENGIVISKTHSPAFTTSTYIISGSTVIPIITYTPEYWSIEVMDQKTDYIRSVLLSPSDFDKIKKGQLYTVK